MIDLKNIENIKANINKKTIKISAEIKELEQLSSELNNTAAEHNREAIKRNPYIVKRVIKHIANGMCQRDAILLTADELGEPTSRVEVLFKDQKYFMSALLLFSKKYACERLKKAGYTAKEIGKVLGVSENHIYKLLKAVPNFWGLRF